VVVVVVVVVVEVVVVVVATQPVIEYGWFGPLQTLATGVPS